VAPCRMDPATVPCVKGEARSLEGANEILIDRSLSSLCDISLDLLLILHIREETIYEYELGTFITDGQTAEKWCHRSV